MVGSKQMVDYSMKRSKTFMQLQIYPCLDQTKLTFIQDKSKTPSSTWTYNCMIQPLPYWDQVKKPPLWQPLRPGLLITLHKWATTTSLLSTKLSQAIPQFANPTLPCATCPSPRLMLWLCLVCSSEQSALSLPPAASTAGGRERSQLSNKLSMTRSWELLMKPWEWVNNSHHPHRLKWCLWVAVWCIQCPKWVVCQWEPSTCLPQPLRPRPPWWDRE